MPLSKTDEQVVKDVVAKLMEHFGTCQIFVTRDEEDGSTSMGHMGQGNLFARILQSGLWAQSEQEAYIQGEMMALRGDDESEEEAA